MGTVKAMVLARNRVKRVRRAGLKRVHRTAAKTPKTRSLERMVRTQPLLVKPRAFIMAMTVRSSLMSCPNMLKTSIREVSQVKTIMTEVVERKALDSMSLKI